MVSKIYQKIEIADDCICECSFCMNFMCSNHPKYNWEDPTQPIKGGE